MLTELKIEKDIPPLLSSHPDHGDREKHLNELMPNAIALRNNVRVCIIYKFIITIFFFFIVTKFLNCLSIAVCLS